MGNDMNILLLYTMTVFDSFGQEPIKITSVQDERLDSNTLQDDDGATNNEDSISGQKKEQDVGQRMLCKGCWARREGGGERREGARH